MRENKKNLEKLLKISIIISTVLISIYIIGGMILSLSEIYFRGVIKKGVFINNRVLSILILTYVGLLIYKNKDSSFLKKLFLVGVIILVIVTAPFRIFIEILMINDETLCYREGKLLVASVSAGFFDSSVKFFEPLNVFFMKSSNLDGFYYKGAYNCYKQYDSIYLTSENIELKYNFNFKDLSSLGAKEKFNKGTFKYLGDHSYDFGNIVIKFNERENKVEKARIEKDIFSYMEGDIKIIGENIEEVKDNILNLEKQYSIKNSLEEEESKIIFEESLEGNEKTIRVIEEDKYITRYLGFKLIALNNIVVAIEIEKEEY